MSEFIFMLSLIGTITIISLALLALLTQKTKKSGVKKLLLGNSIMIFSLTVFKLTDSAEFIIFSVLGLALSVTGYFSNDDSSMSEKK